MGSTTTERAQHTPGPWTVGNRYGNLHTEIAGPHYTRAICYTWTHRSEFKGKGEKASYHESPEGEANARLIAAAPDLLAALKWALEDPDSEILGTDWEAAARAAIARAEGR